MSSVGSNVAQLCASAIVLRGLDVNPRHFRTMKAELRFTLETVQSSDQHSVVQTAPIRYDMHCGLVVPAQSFVPHHPPYNLVPDSLLIKADENDVSAESPFKSKILTPKHSCRFLRPNTALVVESSLRPWKLVDVDEAASRAIRILGSDTQTQLLLMMLYAWL